MAFAQMAIWTGRTVLDLCPAVNRRLEQAWTLNLIPSEGGEQRSAELQKTDPNRLGQSVRLGRQGGRRGQLSAPGHNQYLATEGETEGHECAGRAGGLHRTAEQEVHVLEVP